MARLSSKRADRPAEQASAPRARLYGQGVGDAGRHNNYAVRPPTALTAQLYALSAATGLSDHGCGDELAELLSRFGGDSLVAPARPSGSRVNADGFPVQWVLRLDRAASGAGFVLEAPVATRPVEIPSDHGVGAQVNRTVRSLKSAADRLGWLAPDWIEEVAMPVILGHEPDESLGRTSAVWLAAAAVGGRVHLKLYLTLDRLPLRDRWLRFGRLLQAFGRTVALRRLCEMSGTVSAGSVPVAVGIDVMADGIPGRVKLYVRNEPCDDQWLRRWYQAADADAHFRLVRHLIAACGIAALSSLPERSVFVSAEFGRSDGALSLKTDVPVCRWIADDRLGQAVVMHLADRVGLPTDAYVASLVKLGISCANPARQMHEIVREVACPSALHAARACALHQLVGAGFESDGSEHLNLYLRPPTRQFCQTNGNCSPIDASVV